MIESKEGKKIRDQMWKEIYEVLKANISEIKGGGRLNSRKAA
jgi:hypothetical protein